MAEPRARVLVGGEFFFEHAGDIGHGSFGIDPSVVDVGEIDAAVLAFPAPRASADSTEYYHPFDGSDEVDRVIQERERKLIALSQTPNIYELLARSVAPSIWELDDVKKGILCQLFGGTQKEFRESGIGKFRGDINVLLVGDPGTSKSQLLQVLL